MQQRASLPRGIWAIGSDLSGGTEAAHWLSTAAACAAVTLRRPGGSGAERLAAARTLRNGHAFLALHGHADLATLVHADAILAGVRTLPLQVYAERFPHLLRGASAHDVEEAKAAIDAGAEFLIFGPVWETPEKQGILAPRGLQALEAIASLGLPTLAIGGICSASEVRACMDAGAHGCAVLRAAQDPAIVAELIDAIP